MTLFNLRLLSSYTFSRRYYRSMQDLFVVSKHVKSAIEEGKAVVALESTIITHGMPFPHNYNTAIEVEDIIRQNGVLPATVAGINGKIKIGISKDEMKQLADDTSPTYKLARRDLPMLVSKHASGGTTVSATMLAALHAGIDVFVTGGIGGVHRDAEKTFDVSSDLTELGRTPIAVICAGIKSILDIGKTLEYLETMGVPVATLSNENSEFPAFFTQNSGYKTNHWLRDETEAAHYIHSHLRLGLQTGLVIAVPIPSHIAASGEVIESAIQQALHTCFKQDIRGKDVTPFVLKQVAQLTDDASLKANIALIKNNAHVGSLVAKKLAVIKSEDKTTDAPQITEKCMSRRIKSGTKSVITSRPVIVGGIIVDDTVKMLTDVTTDGATYPGQIRQQLGGVARNIADILSRLETNPLLIAPVGDDHHCQFILDRLKHMDSAGFIKLSSHRTACVCVILSHDGQPLYMIGDMDILNQVKPEHIIQFEEDIRHAPFVCFDGNLPAETAHYLIDLCNHYRIPVIFEPTDRTTAAKVFTTKPPAIHITTPNVAELSEIYAAITHTSPLVFDDHEESLLDRCVSMCDVITDYIPMVLTTLGHKGVLLCHKLQQTDSLFLDIRTERVLRKNNMSALYYTTPTKTEVVSAVGAGDSMMGAFLWSLLLGRDLHTSVHTGCLAARMTLQSHEAVSPYITTSTLHTDNIESHLPQTLFIKTGNPKSAKQN